MVFARTHHLPHILSHVKAVHVLSSPLLKTYFNVIFYVYLRLLSGLYVFLLCSLPYLPYASPISSSLI